MRLFVFWRDVFELLQYRIAGVDIWGLYTDQLVENARLRDRVGELEAAMVPFSDVGALMCRCGKCANATLEIHTSYGRAIIQKSDFIVAFDAMSEVRHHSDDLVPF
ncbi:MAG: hypothetical protein AAF252_09550 [Pseudomonadota bacterium]